MKGSFYLRYALHSLWRNGQRTWLAILCVGFGVMSLVALQIVASNLTDIIMIEPRLKLGGDVRVDRGASHLSATDIAELDHLRKKGYIEAFTTYAENRVQLLKREGTGRVYFLSRAMGVDPEVFPLEGELTLSEPGHADPAGVLKEPLAAAITCDLAQKLHLFIGDTFTLGEQGGGVPERLHVTAIVQSTPDGFGDTVYYSIETARILAGRPEVQTHASLHWGTKGEAMGLLQASGWHIHTPEQVMENNRQISDVFSLALQGAGILGLLVGGIGVANTMQVVLARRTLEVAALKTLGYRQRDLMALFGLETAMLGFTGSILGVAAATVLSTPLLRSVVRIGTLLVDWSANPLLLVGGVLVGTLTAVLFGVYAILRASAVRPAARTWRLRLQAIGVYVVLAAPFAILCSFILGSLIYGIGVIIVALVGLMLLGFLLGAALFLLVRFPMPHIRMLRLARNNLRRQGGRTIFALIALFTGVFAIGFAVTVVLSAREELAAHTVPNKGYNLVIFAGQTHGEQVVEQLERQSAEEVHARYRVPLQATRLQIADEESWQEIEITELEGRADGDVTWDLELTGETWGAVPDGAYLPVNRLPVQMRENVILGSTVKIETVEGVQRGIPLVGLYTPKDMGDLVDRDLADPARGLLVSKDLALELGGSQTPIAFVVRMPEHRLREVTETLGRELPDDTVVSLADLNETFQRLWSNLLVFVVSVAGLALVAGAVLIANAVGLAMVERRRDVGVLKAVGFSSSDVLRTFLLEHGMLGLLSGITGTVGVVVAVEVLNAVEPDARLTFHLLPGMGIMLLSVAIALTSAALVAWRPTAVRPLVVLRDE